MTKSYLQSVFGALFEIMKKQMSASSVLNDVMGVMRAQLANIYAPFSKLMNHFFMKFRQSGFLASRIFQHMYMAMKKAAGVAVASLFASLSLYTTMMNFIDFVIKVIMIIMGILVALAIIFFLPILPVLVIVILTTVGIEAAYPGHTGGIGAVFCFAPGTPVAMPGGTTKKIELLRLGERLADGQLVEAVVEFANDGQAIYNLHGIYVSGDHKVWKSDTQSWGFVKDEPGAIHVEKGPERLWTLITSGRKIPVRLGDKVIQFADWEEIPDTDEAAAVWEEIVRSILPTVFSRVPEDAPCLDGRMRVKKYQGGWVPMSAVRIGDWIYGDSGWTKVLGICRRRAHAAIGPVGSRVTDGIWLKEKGVWRHPTAQPEKGAWDGYALVTASGTYMVRSFAGETHTVRDFTEVGWMNLPATYARVEEVMRQKV
jgi:hypothetical protein